MSFSPSPAEATPLRGQSAFPLHPSGLPVEALRAAFHDTLRLLFVPMTAGRWARLCLICLFLGGGTSTAAFHWSLGSLPSEIGLDWRLAAARVYLAEQPWALGAFVLAVLIGGLILLYLRALCRFALVDTILERRVSPRISIRRHRALARSYYGWLLGALVTLGTFFSVVLILARPHLRAGESSLAVTLFVAGLLAATVLAGLALAVLVALTDDLVVPVMIAERLPFTTAWRRLLVCARAERSTFAVYLLLRFILAVGVGVATLLFLFPALLTLFSGAIITSALAVLSARLLGMEWVWNAATLTLATAALALLIAIVLALLSLAGMPGVVLLQSYGIRFVSPRFPTLRMIAESASQEGS